jgi:hypothetical protein
MGYKKNASFAMAPKELSLKIILTLENISEYAFASTCYILTQITANLTLLGTIQTVLNNGAMKYLH